MFVLDSQHDYVNFNIYLLIYLSKLIWTLCIIVVIFLIFTFALLKNNKFSIKIIDLNKWAFFSLHKKAILHVINSLIFITRVDEFIGWTSESFSIKIFYRLCYSVQNFLTVVITISWNLREKMETLPSVALFLDIWDSHFFNLELKSYELGDEQKIFLDLVVWEI